HRVILRRPPGQAQVAGGELVGVRQIEEGGQQRARLDAARAGELGNLQHLLRGLVAVAGFEVDIGERAVGGAEVDAEGVAGGGAHGSTSAWAITLASWPSASAGRRVSVTRQPRWPRVPVKGGLPTTLPVRRTAAASKPSGRVRRLPSASS